MHIQYHPVPQRTSPVPLGTRKVYYFLRQSDIPVLLRTARYFSSITSHYSRTNSYFSRNTKWYSVNKVRLHFCTSTTPYYKVLLQHQKVLPQHHRVLLQHHQVLVQHCLIIMTHETSFTIRRATGVTIQPHQILRLSCRKLFWFVIITYTTQNCIPKFRKNLWKHLKLHHFQCGQDPRMIRPWPDHDPRIKPSVHNRPRNQGFCGKSNVSRPILHSKPSANTTPATKSDTCASPNILPAMKSDIRTSRRTAPATKSDSSTSPHIALATQ